MLPKQFTYFSQVHFIFLVNCTTRANFIFDVLELRRFPFPSFPYPPTLWSISNRENWTSKWQGQSTHKTIRVSHTLLSILLLQIILWPDSIFTKWIGSLTNAPMSSLFGNFPNPERGGVNFVVVILLPWVAPIVWTTITNMAKHRHHCGNLFVELGMPQRKVINARKKREQFFLSEPKCANKNWLWGSEWSLDQSTFFS